MQLLQLLQRGLEEWMQRRHLRSEGGLLEPLEADVPDYDAFDESFEDVPEFPVDHDFPGGFDALDPGP